jgi:hypothetical protein
MGDHNGKFSLFGVEGIKGSYWYDHSSRHAGDYPESLSMDGQDPF